MLERVLHRCALDRTRVGFYCRVLPNISLGNRVRSEELSLELLQATQLAVIVLTSARFFDCSANESAKLVRRVAMPDVS
ncbi:hypothetical protein OROHE_016902 [Orobanche hederae]